MRKSILALSLMLLPLLLASPAKAMDSVKGWCEEGNRPVVTSGLNSTTRVQASHPSCTVTVYIHGGGLATIYSDNNLTPLANPFTAQSGGRWQAYSRDGRYDVTMSSAGFSQTVTYSDIILCDPFVPGAVCSGAASGSHNLLSTTHLDTIPFSPPVRGDVITAQNQTSPTGVNPSWARLALGATNFVLTSNGTDAVWAPVAGGGCTLPGNDNGVLEEHPIGTCANSPHFTWDNTAFNLQVANASANTVGTGNTFIIGPANNLSGNTFGYILGDTNLLNANTQDHVAVVGFSNIVRSVEGVGTPGGGNFSTVSIGSNTIGSATANTGGKNNIVAGNNSVILRTENSVVLGSSSSGTTGGSAKITNGTMLGGNFIGNCVSGSSCASSGNGAVDQFLVAGDNNLINQNGSGSVAGAYMFGLTNRVDTTLGNTTGGSFIFGFDNENDKAIGNDVGIWGVSNTAHNSQTATCLGASDNGIWGLLNVVTGSGNYMVYGGGNTVTSLNCVVVLGVNVTPPASQTLYVGMSPTAEIQVANSSATNGVITQISYSIANANPTGTTVNHIAKLSGAPSLAIITTAGDTSGAVGIVAGGAGTTGNAIIAFSGMTMCTFDGATTAGNYVQISGTVNGDCHDAGSSFPGAGQVLGRVLSTNGGGGTYKMILFSPSK